MYICTKICSQMFKLSQIKELAHEVGFDLCGVAQYRKFEDDRAFLEGWIERGYASSLEYLKRNIECRADANLLVEGAKSVIVCAVAYKNSVSEGYPADHSAKVASYACTTDYHTTIKQMLFDLCKRLKEVNPALSARCFVDSAPIFEKRYAVEAGWGWITKFVEGKDFIDRELLAEQKANGVERKLVGLKMIDRGIPRHEYKVADTEGNEIGHITSGTMSPCLKVGIGMAYVKTEFAKVGTVVCVIIRDRLLKAEVVKLPFV